MAGALKSDDEELPLLGSWTPFNREVTDHLTTACIQEFLPKTPHPPEYPICKEYLDFLLEIIEELELPHIFVHSDEMVYSKLCDIVWKNSQLYKGIILLMGGHSKKYLNFPIVSQWKFGGNGQFSLGN